MIFFCSRSFPRKTRKTNAPLLLSPPTPSPSCDELLSISVSVFNFAPRARSSSAKQLTQIKQQQQQICSKIFGHPQNSEPILASNEREPLKIWGEKFRTKIKFNENFQAKQKYNTERKVKKRINKPKSCYYDRENKIIVLFYIEKVKGNCSNGSEC